MGMDNDTLHFQFWMSPPVPHADLTFVRSGPEPSFIGAIMKLMLSPYKQCRFVDHYGPNIPGEPDLKPNKTGVEMLSSGVAGWAHAGVEMSGHQSVSLLAKHNPSVASLVDDAKALVSFEDSNGGGTCRQLNGFNFMTDQQAKNTAQFMNVPDVKIQYKVPKGPCDPCDVSYSVSAKIDEDEYIAVGFKGQSWEGKFPYPPDKEARPCYFGML